MAEEYDTSGVLPSDDLESVKPGTNLAIVGPAMSGKNALAIELLTAGYDDGNGFMCITTRDSVARVVGTFERFVPSMDSQRIGVVDCSGSDRTTSTDVLTERAASPADLTGISIAMAKLHNQFQQRGITELRHALISVSTLLRYLDVNRVFKFLHIYTRRVDDTESFGVFTLDDDTHDPQVVNTISSQFDYVIRLRETDSGDTEFQIREMGRRPTAWQPLD